MLLLQALLQKIRATNLRTTKLRTTKATVMLASDLSPEIQNQLM
ncbi:MAG: hypothetical protein ACI9LM_001481 [Alteromonadaceae bacterium]|jgi:hypothetical protein